jgi:hypothetical protein
MLYNYLRVIQSDNGVLTDRSIDNQDETTTLPLALVKDEDYYYVGQHFPCNNFYMKVNTVNDVSANINIEYYDNTQWRSAVDILDATKISGVPVARSGVIQFSPDTQYRWHKTADTTTGQFPDELSTLNIFNVYWFRFSYSQSLNASTALDRITYSFSSSQQIDNLDKDVADYLDDFGLTTWEDPIITSSESVVLDLMNRGIILNRGEILNLQDVTRATDWQTLIWIYRNLGGDFKDKLTEAKANYQKSFGQKLSLDRNEDAFLSAGEISSSARVLTR